MSKQTVLMLELLRAAVFDREPVVEVLDNIDWDLMMQEAGEQGVLGWVWESIQKLPKDKQPNRQQRINWGLSAQEIVDHYEKQKELLRYLVNECDKNGMRMLMFKGLDFARLYTKPELRKYGDIDCYMFDDYDKFNKLFQPHFDNVTELHSELLFGDILVENHKAFVYPGTIQRKRIENYLCSSLDRVHRTKGGYWNLDPIAYLVYLTQHALNHLFIGGHIPMRSLVDFAMWLKNHSSYLPPEDCHVVMSKLGIENGFEVLLRMSETILDISFDEYIRGLLSKDYVQFIRDWVGNGYEIIELDKIKKGKVLTSLMSLKKIKKYMLKTSWKERVTQNMVISIKALLGIPTNKHLRDTLLECRK